MNEYDKEGALIRRGPSAENLNELSRREGWPVVGPDGYPYVIVRRKKNRAKPAQ